MRKTYKEIQKELLSKSKGLEKARQRASSFHEESLTYRKHLKTLITQYERVIREKNKIIKDYQENAWKIIFVFLADILRRFKQKFL